MDLLPKLGKRKGSTYLCDAESSPFVLPEQLQGSLLRVVVILGYRLEHCLGELDMSVLVFAIGVSDCW